MTQSLKSPEGEGGKLQAEMTMSEPYYDKPVLMLHVCGMPVDQQRISMS